jgi:hypothetical protein
MPHALRTTLLLLASSLLLALVACGGESSDEVAPGEVQLASPDQLTAFRYDMTITMTASKDNESSLAPDLAMELSGAVITPDREQSTIKVDFGFFKIEAETIQIGSQSWTRESGGEWKEDSDGGGTLPLDVSPLDILGGNEFASLQSVISGLTGKAERMNGLDAVRYELTAEEFAKAFPEDAGSSNDDGLPTDDLEDMTVVIWIARESGIPTRLTIEGTSTDEEASGIVKLELNLTDLNSDSIKIEAPI